MLSQFTQPAILRQVGHTRLAMFFEGFREELLAAPLIPLSTINPELSTDLAPVAAILATPALLPERLRAALLKLETAASPENRDRLNDALFRRLPCISLKRECPLDCALELWFAVPDELAQFESSAGVSPAAPIPSPSCDSTPSPPPEQRVRGEEAPSIIHDPPSIIQLPNHQPSTDSETFTRLAQLSPADYD